MTIEQIRYFLMLSQHLNFTKTAEVMYTTQPTISRQIRMLEEELGFELIQRNSSPLRLTQAGEHLYPKFKEAYDMINIGIKETQDRLACQNGTLQVSCLVSLDADVILANSFQEFHDAYPHIHFTYEKQSFEVLSSQLSNHTADIVITLESKTNVFLNTEQKFLFDSTGICLFSKKHPLAKKKSCSLHDFKDETFICLTENASPRGINGIYKICESYGFSCKKVLRVPNLESVFFYVETCQGVALLDKSIRSIFSSAFRYIDTPVPDAIITAVALWDSENRNTAISPFLSILERNVKPFIDMYT